jgi:hypothetical protein
VQRRAWTVGLVLVGLSVAGCSDGPKPADPLLNRSLSHFVIVSDRVDCPVDPEGCERDVVLRPVGETEAELYAQISAYMRTRVGWKLVAHPRRTVSQYGQVFDGPTSYAGTDYGGYLSDTASELVVWRREHLAYSGGSPPDTAAIATQTAMANTPNGVYVEILGSTCGSYEHCQGG